MMAGDDDRIHRKWWRVLEKEREREREREIERKRGDFTFSRGHSRLAAGSCFFNKQLKRIPQI